MVHVPIRPSLKSKLTHAIFILLYLMTTLTNSEDTILNYTNEFIETILLQLNPSNNYYTTGDDDILFIKIGSNKALVLDYTYHINRHIFQNYTIHGNPLNNCDLECILDNTSNGYDLQQVYNVNGFLGIITDLSQVFLAIYDTGMSSHTYTCGGNIDTTDNQISLNFPLNINGEIVLNPRVNIYLNYMLGHQVFTFLQNTVDGSQPTAISNSLGKSINFSEI